MKTYMFEFDLPNDEGKRRVVVDDEANQGVEQCLECVRMRYRLPSSKEVRFIEEYGE